MPNDSLSASITVAVSPVPEAVAEERSKPRFRIAHTNELRTVIPVQTLNDAAKPMYTFLRRPASYMTPVDLPAVEEQPAKKHPKTLMGLFNSN